MPLPRIPNPNWRVFLPTTAVCDLHASTAHLAVLDVAGMGMLLGACSDSDHDVNDGLDLCLRNSTACCAATHRRT